MLTLTRAFYLLAWSDSNTCAGLRVEGDWFSLQTPYSRRAFYLIKTMQLSKPAHGLRETYLHVFLQTVSYIFWNAKWELFRKDVLLGKKTDQSFFLLLTSNMQLSSHGAFLLHACIAQWCTLVRGCTHLVQKSIFICPISCFIKILLFNLN